MNKQLTFDFVFFKPGPLFCATIFIIMPMLHDPQYRSNIEKRLAALRSDSKPRWGTMSVDQMLWHVNEALALSVGQTTAPPQKMPLPRPIMKFVVLNLPWPKGAPTAPQLEARQHYDFEAERTRCSHLLDTFTRKKLEEDWPLDAFFGKVNGRFKSKLQAKHMDHHLRQFGV